MKKYIPNRWKREIKYGLRNIVESLRYYVLDNRLDPRSLSCKGPVVFVCKGNVCRSAFAEARMQMLAGPEADNACSCGLDVDPDSPPPPAAVKTALAFGCDLSGRRARKVKDCNIKGAGLILAMEYSQWRALTAMFPEKKEHIRLLRQYAPFPFFLFCNIDDPYGWEEPVFQTSFRLIDKGLRGLLAGDGKKPL